MTVCAVVNLAPACVEITGVRAGDRNLIAVTVNDHGVPVNLTGMVPLSQVRKTPVDTLVAISADVQFVDAAAGKITIRWDGEDVRDLLAGAKRWKGFWDLQFKASGEDPVTYASGPWSAEADVSHT